MNKADLRFKRIAIFPGHLNTTECFNDQSEENKAGRHHIQLLEAREDASKALESAEQAIQGTAEWAEPIQQFTAFGCNGFPYPMYMRNLTIMLTRASLYQTLMLADAMELTVFESKAELSGVGSEHRGTAEHSEGALRFTLDQMHVVMPSKSGMDMEKFSP